MRGRGGVRSLMFWWGMPMHTSRSGRACWWRQYPFVQVLDAAVTGVLEACEPVNPVVCRPYSISSRMHAFGRPTIFCFDAYG